MQPNIPLISIGLPGLERLEVYAVGDFGAANVSPICELKRLIIIKTPMGNYRLLGARSFFIKYFFSLSSKTHGLCQGKLFEIYYHRNNL